MSEHLRAQWRAVIAERVPGYSGYQEGDDIWMAAMGVHWYKDLPDDTFDEGNGDYCLDHGFAKVAEMRQRGYVVVTKMHANYGQGCDECGARSDLRDERTKDVGGRKWWAT